MTFTFGCPSSVVGHDLGLETVELHAYINEHSVNMIPRNLPQSDVDSYQQIKCHSDSWIDENCEFFSFQFLKLRHE